MALDLISFGLGTSKFTITSFNLGPVSTLGWSILGVRIKLKSKLFKNQREDGSYIVDGRMLNPTELTVTLVAQSKSAVDTINSMLKDRSTVYTITTRGITFSNMLLQNQALSQSADNISSQPINLIFKQLMTEDVDLPTTRQLADSSVIDRGIAYVKETAESVTSLASNVLSKVKGFF